MGDSRVFFDASRLNAIGIDEAGPSAYGDFPALKECALYFNQYLHRGAGVLRRELLRAIERDNFCLLEVDLKALQSYQHHVHDGDLKCASTPICDKKAHQPPPYYAAQLSKALRERPLRYLTTCESVATRLAERSAVRGSDQNSQPLGGVQINLIDTSVKPTAIRQLLARHQEQFVVVPGIIVQASTPQKRVSKMVIQCRFCNHRMTLEVPPWKDKPQIPAYCRYSQTASNTGEGMGAGGDPGCKQKQDPYFILWNESTFIDTQSLKMQELPEDVPTGDMPRHLSLNVSRKLCEKMIPGDRVYVHGVLTSSGFSLGRQTGEMAQAAYLHILGIQKYDETKGEDTHFDSAEIESFRRLANSPNVHEKLFRSIAPAIYGMDDVKKACASLLFGGTRKRVADGSKLRGDINVLLLGDPSVAKSQILKFVDRVAPVSVYTSGKGSSAAGLTAAVLRDRNGVFSLEGGAMVLADGGVVCIDEFDKMRADDVVAIHEAMEQQTISISKAGITTMLNTRCAVIAAANPSFGSFDDTQDTADQHEFKATILSRFDLIFILRDKEDYERDTALSSHILSLHAQARSETEGEVPLRLLRRYIQFAKQQPPPMLSQDARASLRNFYCQTRADSRDDKRTVTRKIPITLRQLESLIRLAESFAKMELSELATEQHVKMAIDLFTVSTAETAKHALVFESMTAGEQKAVRQAESAILGCIQAGQRVSRNNLFRNLQIQGFDRSVLSKSLSILLKRGELQERGDRSIRRP